MLPRKIKILAACAFFGLLVSCKKDKPKEEVPAPVAIPQDSCNVEDYSWTTSFDFDVQDQRWLPYQVQDTIVFVDSMLAEFPLTVDALVNDTFITLDQITVDDPCPYYYKDIFQRRQAILSDGLGGWFVSISQRSTKVDVHVTTTPPDTLHLHSDMPLKAGGTVTLLPTYSRFGQVWDSVYVMDRGQGAVLGMAKDQGVIFMEINAGNQDHILVRKSP